MHIRHAVIPVGRKSVEPCGIMKRICNWIHPFWDTILVICRRSFLFSCGFWVNARQRWLRWYRRTYSEGNPKSYSKRHGETMPIWRCDNAIIALLSCLEVWMIHFVHRMLSIHRRKEGRFYFLLFILSVPNIFSFSSSPELLRGSGGKPLWGNDQKHAVIRVRPC